MDNEELGQSKTQKKGKSKASSLVKKKKKSLLKLLLKKKLMLIALGIGLLIFMVFFIGIAILGYYAEKWGLISDISGMSSSNSVFGTSWGVTDGLTKAEIAKNHQDSYGPSNWLGKNEFIYEHKIDALNIQYTAKYPEVNKAYLWLRATLISWFAMVTFTDYYDFSDGAFFEDFLK